MSRTVAIALALALVGSLLFLVFSVQAQQRCWPRSHVSKFLLDRHGEVVLVRALTNPHGGAVRVFELFSNPAKRTWTVVLTDQAGTACLQGSGTDLDMVAEVAPAKGDPS